jgi:O-methyltransferase involved in polyketide biosynthesis
MARTDGDTWDLASSVGATATGVAASRALASKQPTPLISDPFADALVKAVGPLTTEWPCELKWRRSGREQQRI